MALKDKLKNLVKKDKKLGEDEVKRIDAMKKTADAMRAASDQIKNERGERPR